MTLTNHNGEQNFGENIFYCEKCFREIFQCKKYCGAGNKFGQTFFWTKTNEGRNKISAENLFRWKNCLGGKSLRAKKCLQIFFLAGCGFILYRKKFALHTIGG